METDSMFPIITNQDFSHSNKFRWNIRKMDEKMYINDFEDLFPLWVRFFEEILSSVLMKYFTEQFSKQDVSNEPTQVNYGIKTSPTVDSSWVTSFNSVYTRTSFDGKSRYDGNFSFTDDFSRFSGTYGKV